VSESISQFCWGFWLFWGCPILNLCWGWGAVATQLDVQAEPQSAAMGLSESVRCCEWHLSLTEMRNGVCSHGDRTQQVDVDAVGTYE